MKTSQAVLKYLKDSGVEHIFALPAGNISSLIDSLNDIELPYTIHKNEACVLYSTVKYSSISKNMGVALIAGAVGIGNAVNGICEARRSKLPILVLSGYVKTWQRGKGAIQELDNEDMLKSVTKYSKTVWDKEDVLSEIKKAIEIANTVPCGPVHISIPIDIQMDEFTGKIEVPTIRKGQEIKTNNVLPSDVRKAIELVDSTDKGIIMVGQGARGYGKLVENLSEKLGWPIVTTPAGKSVVDNYHKNYYGNFGFASTDKAEDIMKSAEYTCILAIGTSLGESATKNYDNSLFEGRKLIHIDNDLYEKDKNFKADIFIHGSIEIVLNNLNLMLNVRVNDNTVITEGELNKPYTSEHTGVSVRKVMEELPLIMPKETVYLSDIGETINYSFKYLLLPSESEFEVNLNYGCMGSAIGGAIGAKVARPNHCCVVISGDGSFFMNGTDMITAKEYNIPIIYIIINNGMYGYVEKGHKYLFGRSTEGFVQTRLDISKIAQSYGLESIQINSNEELIKIKDFIQGKTKPCLIEINTDGTETLPLDRFKSLKG